MAKTAATASNRTPDPYRNRTNAGDSGINVIYGYKTMAAEKGAEEDCIVELDSDSSKEIRMKTSKSLFFFYNTLTDCFLHLHFSRTALVDL